MPSEGDGRISLTTLGGAVWYSGRGLVPVFRCSLQPDLMRQLGHDPASVLATPQQPPDFWLRVLTQGILRGGQFVFETCPPPGTHRSPIDIAVRCLFQLNGDVVVKVHEQILTDGDCLEILAAHSAWTGWCLKQLGQALALSATWRYLGWGCVGLGLALFGGGFGAHGVVLQSVAVLFLIPGHLLLSPALLRYLRWLPFVLGASPAAMFGLAMPEGLAGALALLWHPGTVTAVAGALGGPVAGWLLPGLAWKMLTRLRKRKMGHACAQ